MSNTQLATASDLEKMVSLVSDGLSAHSKRAYRRVISDFLTWYAVQGKPGLSKAIVASYVDYLQAQGKASATVNQALAIVKKLAREAGDNGLLDSATALAIVKVKRVNGNSKRGHWLTLEQAQCVLAAPDVTTLKGARDKAILAVLIGCGLRREEIVNLTPGQLRISAGHWGIYDLVGKRGKVRDVPLPGWVKKAIDCYLVELARERGELVNLRNESPIFVSINKGGAPGESLTAQAIWDVVKTYTTACHCEVAPHDLRRSFAKLAKEHGCDLEQIQFALGHSSLKTTQNYLGTAQDFDNAPGDFLG